MSRLTALPDIARCPEAVATRESELLLTCSGGLGQEQTIDVPFGYVNAGDG